MLLNELRNIKSDDKTLRNFCILFGVIFIIICIYLFLKGTKDAHHLYLVSVFFFVIGFTKPKFILPLYKIWMRFALIIGHIVSTIIITLLFYLVLTPTGIILRLTGKDFLNSTFDRKLSSYWTKRSEKDMINSAEKQF
ncbi:SxtJ family membrane protein [candidate division KSB1 bacterium]